MAEALTAGVAPALASLAGAGAVAAADVEAAGVSAAGTGTLAGIAACACVATSAKGVRCGLAARTGAAVLPEPARAAKVPPVPPITIANQVAARAAIK